MGVKKQIRNPESLTLQSEESQIGILLIHGFTGTTLELKLLAEYLNKQGYTVHAPLLKGHGATPEEMRDTTWVDWWISAKEGYEWLRTAGYQQIIVIGLSMGGLLALKIAQYQKVLGIVTLCAPVIVRDKRMGMVKYLKPWMEYKKRGGQKPEHIENELFHYDKTPLAAVVSLENLMKNVSRVIPFIKQPILIVQSEKDETVDPCSGQMLYDSIGSSYKKLKWFKESGHIITLDYEKDKLFTTISEFVEEIQLKH